MIPGTHISLLEDKLCMHLDAKSSISNLISVHGGSINAAYKFEYDKTVYFLKQNKKNNFTQMFLKEINGLNELRKSKELIVPEPLFEMSIESEQYLVLSYLTQAPDSNLFFEKLGRGLANMHTITHEGYGFYEDNYIGFVYQSNHIEDNWANFFYLQRIEPLVRWCFDEKLIQKRSIQSFEGLYGKLNEIFPSEKPALLHGDLWNGNKMNCVLGPAIFDPAVYYGHREMDIAMTRLFGGFEESFYKAYEATNPLEKNHKHRTDICNLYPLLVHVKLFGTSYLQDILATIKRF